MLGTATRTALALAAMLAFGSTPLAAQSARYAADDQVIAQWGDGRWYPGHVVSAVGDNFRIRFLDGDVATLPTTRIRPDTFEPGDPLFVRKHDGLKRAVLSERYGNALVVSYPDGATEAVDLKRAMLDTVTTRISRDEKYFKPAVLANLCNATSETVYYALAMDTYNDGMRGNASTGWTRLAPRSCEIRNLSQHWRTEVRLPSGDEERAYGFMSPTYIYGQTREAFRTRVLGGAVTIGSGKRWGGDGGEDEYCIMDSPTIAFRHVVDHGLGLLTKDYCRDNLSFKVPFRKLELPGAGNRKGGVVDWTFGE
ncbi:MAG: DUF1036 domain-containing protein [Erythrobacter sp.]|nr:DUF1036 domain-containing protein [Erythrobacter sp.]